ncbi:MAG: PilX N-terminal domain-containing pilus assembly protein, partial [Nitrospinota bacterium]
GYERSLGMSERKSYKVMEERGVVLILSLLVMTVLSVLGLAFLATARTEDTIASNYRNHTAAFYAAEAGLESQVASLKSILGGGLPTTAQLTAIVPAALTDASYTFDAFQVSQVRPTPYNSTITNGPYVGLNALMTPFEITASVTGPRGSRAQLRQVINYVQIPLFQFAIYYGKGIDLDMSPSPPTVITGRIHANSDIYIAGALEVKLDGRISSTEKIYRYSKLDGPNPAPGDRGVNTLIKDASGTYQELNFDHEYDYDFNNSWSESDWNNAAMSTFGGTVQDGAMGVGEIIPPVPGAFYDPANPDKSSHQIIEAADASDTAEMKNAKMYYKADLIIVDEKAYNQAGSEVKLNKCDGPKGAKAVKKTKFYDPREMKDVEVTEIDIGLLNSCGLMPANGILYAHRTKGDSDKGKGVRLKNGAELPGTGLTVASEDPVYIQGDYNTQNKVPAAVMGDAIYALSNNWEKNDYDNKTEDKYSSSDRPAADTTINAALMLGYHDEAKSGEPNGEHENIVRLLEDWRDGGSWPNSNHTLTLNGSIVSLWHSQVATAGFDRPDGKRYRTPPNRPWSYDTLFDTQLPPGTPMGIIMTRGQWSQG